MNFELGLRSFVKLGAARLRHCQRAPIVSGVLLPAENGIRRDWRLEVPHVGHLRARQLLFLLVELLGQIVQLGLEGLRKLFLMLRQLKLFALNQSAVFETAGQLLPRLLIHQESLAHTRQVFGLLARGLAP